MVLDREWPGCPGIWVGTSRIWKNFMQENFGLIFVPYITFKGMFILLFTGFSFLNDGELLK